MKQYKYLFLFLVLLTTVLLYLWPNFHPDKVLGDTHKWWMDLLTHGGYFFVASLAIFSIPFKIKSFYKALLFFLLSILLELGQYFSYQRTLDPMDIFFNLTGVLTALVLYYIVVIGLKKINLKETQAYSEV